MKTQLTFLGCEFMIQLIKYIHICLKIGILETHQRGLVTRVCLLETLAAKQALGNRQLNLSNYLEMTFPRGQQLSSFCIVTKSPLIRYRGRIELNFFYCSFKTQNLQTS